MKLSNRPFVAYGLTVAGVALATVVRIPVEPLLQGRAPYALYYLPILFTAWRWGVGPTAVAIILSLVASWAFIIPTADPGYPATIALFLLVSGAMMILALAAKRLRVAKEDARAHLAAIVESSGDAILSEDLDGVIRSCNRAAERMFGYRADEMIGQPVTMLMPPERRSEEAEILERLRRGERVEQFVTERVTKDGRRLSVSLTTSPVRDASGAIIGASKIARDITAQKRADDEVAAQREGLRVTLSSIGDGVITSDVEGRIAFLNPVAEGLTGWSSEEARGRPLADVFHIVNEETRRRVEQPSQKVVERGHVVGLANHTLLIARDGSERPIADSAAPIRDQAGRIAGIVLVFRDASEQRAAAIERERLLELERAARLESERANRLKDDFVAMVSHELRTPLTAIMGWAQMLRTEEMDPVMTRRAIETIGRNAEAQAKLISDLMDLSGILSGKLSLDTRLVDLSVAIENAIQATRHTSEEKGVPIRVATSGGIEILGDPLRIQQVIQNLVTNAIKFTPKGGHVDVLLERRDDRAVVVVSDTGRGIDPQFLPRVFDRFSQADSSTTRRQGGLGLGLAIVRHLVGLHNGTVIAESPGANQGATFTVTLPLAPTCRPDSRGGDLGAADCGPELLAGCHILVVDDEPDTLELLSLTLRRCGAEVTAVHSAGEALGYLATRVPDIVISDIGMPEQDGYALIRAIRRLPPAAGGTVPAIAVTAFTGGEDRRAALAAGFQEHIAKPISPSILARAIADLIRTTRR